MKRITVYADFDFLSAPQEIGTLGYEHVRGKDHFAFEYSRQWLKQHGGILLSGDMLNVPSLQHPRGNDNVFGFVKDSFPDRWGRLLLDRRERLAAQQEGRPKRMLTDYDYLVGIEDFTRMGGIRYKEEKGSDYINANAKYHVPPIESLRALCDACHEIADDPSKAADREKEKAFIRAGKLMTLAQIAVPNMYYEENLRACDEKIRETVFLCETHDPEGICSSIDGLRLRPDLRPVLADPQCPVLVVCGGHDNYISPARIEEMKAAFPKVTFCLVEESGHNAFIERQDEVVAAIQTFIN